MDCLSCPVEVVGLVEGGSLNTTTPIMAHDDDVADLEFRHTVRDDGDGVEVPIKVLVRDVAFGEEDTRGRRENRSFGNSGVAVWSDRMSAINTYPPASNKRSYLHPRKRYSGNWPLRA